VNCDVKNLSRLSSCLRCLTDGQLSQIKTYLLCQWAQRAGGAAPSNLDITDSSTAANIVLTWTNPTPAGTTNEVWRSSDGITFALLTTVGGSVATATDASGLAVGNFFYYKVRSCSSGACSAFSSIISCCNNYTSPNVASISFPTLIRAFGSFNATGLPALTSISLPALKSVTGDLDLSNDNLTTISLPSLKTVAGSLHVEINPLTALNLPVLTTVGSILAFNSTSLVTVSFPALVSVDSVQFSSMPNLTTATFGALTSVGGFDGDNSTLLTTVSIPNAMFLNGRTLDLSLCALNAASVNQVLARGVASVPALTTYDFELAGGTNAAPSGQGIADKATLQGQGNTVNTN
jgi:hypothetical protein